MSDELKGKSMSRLGSTRSVELALDLSHNLIYGIEVVTALRLIGVTCGNSAGGALRSEERSRRVRFS